MIENGKIAGAAVPGAPVLNPLAVYNDPLLPSYWHLGGTSGTTKGINVLDVWSEFRGDGILVGVVDDGIDYNHVELSARYALGFDYDTRDGDDDAYSSSPGDRHGTAVAGAIAGSLNNGAGGAGAAPEATITGFRIGYGVNGTESQLEAAFDRAAGVDIVNNSWGYDGFLGDDFASPAFAPVAEQLEAALDTGRGGLGTVVVFAAGNGRAQGQDVNYHNFQNHRGVITVAATDSAGNFASFSTPGEAILVAAPGVNIITTDRIGTDGYVAGDYVTASGTSFSAPLVSGVIALMLDANPVLGWRDVQEILAMTASITGGSGSAWNVNHATNWNGGAEHVSRNFGFGLVDAMAAVRVAESWHDASTSANEAVASNQVEPNAVIPDMGSVVSTIVLGDDVRIDRVEIGVQITHADIGSLRLILTSPAQTQSWLFTYPPTTQDDINFSFSSTHFLGERSSGPWKLAVVDMTSGDFGTLERWTIRAYGDANADDTYVYTEEFSTLAPTSASRRTLVDAAGVDGINTAAIASGTVINLNAGAVSLIDGQSVTIGAATQIENADTGDGNDTITGNGAANWLRGWRGNDQLNGGAGIDRLEGAAGNDTLNGGTGADTMIGGGGHDAYYVDAPLDIVVENPNEGNDTVYTVITHTLAPETEALVLLGASAIHASGNALGNSLVGNAAANQLLGLAGNDILNGYGGDDSLDGGPGADRLIGGDGNDSMNGRAGADSMTGGPGHDAYYIDDALDAVIENPNEGNDTVYIAMTHTLAPNTEALVMLGNSAMDGSGNALGNSMVGNSAVNRLVGMDGNDTLNGYGGADAMFGGIGNDIYYVDNALDTTVENAGEGYDSVRSTVTYALPGNVERLDLTGMLAADGTGNTLDNLLNGNSGVNRLDGGAGADSLLGGAGDDVFVFQAGQAAGDSVLDFTGSGPAAGDFLNFLGFGPGATFAAATADNWLITYEGGAMSEMIRLAGVTSLDVTDYAFV